MRLWAPWLGIAQWWNGRSGRERMMLAGLLGLIVFSLIHSSLVRPLLTNRAEARARISEYDRALAQLANAPVVPQAAQGAPGAPASTILTQKAAEFGLRIIRIEPKGAAASLILGNTDFAHLLDWIKTVEREGGLALTQAEIERRPEPGIVAATLEFGHP